MNRKIIFAIFFTVSLICKCYCIYFHYTPYSGLLKEIKTQHFIIVFSKQHEDVGRIIADYAEQAYEELTPFMKWKPIWRTTIILSDESDIPNGMATSALRNTIVLYLSPSQLNLSLSGTTDSLWNLVVHEFTHVLHLDQIRDGGWFWRVLFGKLYIPNSGSFTWNIEGMATFTESKFGSGGRLRSPYMEAVISDAAQNKAIPDYDRVLNCTKDFPYGQASYLYGASFLQYLYHTYGEEKFQEVYYQISKDFFPFILKFMFTMKKVYGKSVDRLWDDWRQFEYSKWEQSVDATDDYRYEFSQITDVADSIDCFTFDDNENLYYFADGYKTDSFLYKKKLLSDEKPQKLIYGSMFDMTFADDMLFYVKTHSGLDSRLLNDLYGYNLEKNIEYRYTFSGKISYVTACKNYIVAVRQEILSSQILLFQIDDGKIIKKGQLRLPKHLCFINSIDFSPNGDKLVFSATDKDGKTSLFCYYFIDMSFRNMIMTHCDIVKDDVKCSSVKFYDESSIVFLQAKDFHNDIYKYDLENNQAYKVFENNKTFPFALQVCNGKIYYLGYTHKGFDIFAVQTKENCLVECDLQYKDDLFFDNSTDKSRFNQYGIHNKTDTKHKMTNYNWGRYLAPTIWAIVPEMLSSTFYSIPFIAPRLMFIMESPTGRMSYTGSITYDYLKQYPQNDFSLTFNLPCTTIGLNWKNWAGGNVIYDKEGFHSAGTINGRYSVNFSDSIYISPFFSITDFLQVGLYVCANHTFNQWTVSNYDMKTKKGDYKYLQNTINFVEKFVLQILLPKSRCSRINRGMYFDVVFYQAPEQILNNNISTYLINARLQFMVPFYNIYYFGLLQGGSEIASHNNLYSVNSSLYKILQSVPSIMGNSSLNVIDGKAFGNTFFVQQKVNGFAYVSYDSGFDITLYDKPHYWHFATLGFKELFMRVYNQYIYLFSQNQTFDHFFVDTVLEMTLQLLVGYDRYTFELSVGAAIGYQGTATKPNFGVFFSFNATVG